MGIGHWQKALAKQGIGHWALITSAYNEQKTCK
jgi:hypothetical protein